VGREDHNHASLDASLRPAIFWRVQIRAHCAASVLFITAEDDLDEVRRRVADIRREFVKVHESSKSATAWEAIERIAALYEVEKRARFKSPQDRVALRQEQVKPIFDDLEVWLREQLNKISGKTPMAKAIRYALTRLPKARPYLDHGVLELDNNTAERAVRPVTLGRKNYLFMGSIAGGHSGYAFIARLKAVEKGGG
jgi:hypothetical protein